MWRTMMKVMAATAAFGLVHSALASRGAKRAVARAFGERNRNGLYRVFYLAQSAAYLVVGSLHEEARLREAYGDAYSAYQGSGVAFYLPRPARSSRGPTGLAAHDPPAQNHLVHSSQ
jgi:hypothetical protein